MKVLLLDIETAPNTAYMWGMWQELNSTKFIVDDWFIMCWSAKWLGEKKIMGESVHENPDYKKNPRDDKRIMIELKKLLNEADIVIAHNGVKFDCKKIRARFILNGIKPASPYTVIDTLTHARGQFAFTSNRLDDLGKFLKLGKKVDTGGFELWSDCLDQKIPAWKKMVKYCKNDVILLEKVYRAIRPFIKKHPNSSTYLDTVKPVCPKCGSDDIWYQGYAYTGAGKFKRFQCKTCYGWGREKENLHNKKKKASMTTNIN